MLKYVETKEAPAAIGPYSQGVVVNGFAFFSGQVPLSPQTGEVVGTTIEEQAEQERDKAVAFCSTIQDARLYLIFRLRFVRCLTWAEVADLLGDYYTEEGVCRMAYNYLAKTEKEKPTAQSA